MDEELVNGIPLDYDAYLSWCKSWYLSLPEVTISAFTEMGQQESSIIVPLQRAYTATLGTHGLLDHLNSTLGTSYTLDRPFLSNYLQGFVDSKDDFGQIYGLLRGVWYTDDWSMVQNQLGRQEEEEWEQQQEALDGNWINNRILLPPRRVWDLYSNRVVPYWVMDTTHGTHRWPRPISHAWAAGKDCIKVCTPINGYEWPVPIPKDVNLNLICIEMLNLGLEYVWLDVLCLRQEGGEREDWRREEWKLDVPTIGLVYWDEEVVIYLGGLGRPLTLKEGDLDSDRSWFRRAWTLQEIGSSRVFAGDTPDGPLHAKANDGTYETELLTRFHRQLQFRPDGMLSVSEALLEMRKRLSTNPVDRIAGLATLMVSETIPAYYESATVEDAWSALVNAMHEDSQAELFFISPEPGDGGAKWRLSWDQAMTKPLLDFDFHDYGVFRFLHWDETGGVDVCSSGCIEGKVLGLAVVNEGDRHGELIIESNGRIEQFQITAPHIYAISEDTYTLIYGDNHGKNSYIVGWSLPGDKFEKVSMVEMSDEEQKRLDGLGIVATREYILV